MNRFDYDDGEEYQDDMFSNEGISQEEYKAMMEKREAIDFMQLELATLDLKQQLLFKVIKSLEKSFWWRFKSTKRRVEEINLMFYEMLFMINPPTDEEMEG